MKQWHCVLNISGRPQQRKTLLITITMAISFANISNKINESRNVRVEVLKVESMLLKTNQFSISSTKYNPIASLFHEVHFLQWVLQIDTSNEHCFSQKFVTSMDTNPQAESMAKMASLTSRLRRTIGGGVVVRMLHTNHRESFWSKCERCFLYDKHGSRVHERSRVDVIGHEVRDISSFNALTAFEERNTSGVKVEVRCFLSENE